MRKRTHDRSAKGRPGVRCAVYTRKSSEEGLEQDFNSLDAQREACEAYILSQKHEGWLALPQMYDDGGVSGGTMDRAALKRLLADIEVGKIDTVVVYKVDRLTRSFGLRQDRGRVRSPPRQLRLDHAIVQHHDLNGPAHPQYALVLRPVRARGHGRAHPRQDRRLEAQGHLGRRHRAARIRGAGAQARDPGG